MKWLVLLVALSACGTGVSPCEDADGDGFCAEVDCDDADPLRYPADRDGDGQSACDDCDDADATRDSYDRDGDGQSSCEGDCDDADPRRNTLDADGDGQSSCAGDCDDADAERSSDRPEQCGNLVDEDCSGAANDADVDGDGLLALACGGGDCDDTDASVQDGSCAPACADDAPDADADGLCDALDVSPNNPWCGAVAVDLDGDGRCADADVDDLNPGCGAVATDADGDGTCADQDTNDNNRSCTTSFDADGDGLCAEVDVDDSNADCGLDPTDADEDGVCADHDIDDSNPLCADDASDVDGDGVCDDRDCDALGEYAALCGTDCGTWFFDQDGDGYPSELHSYTGCRPSTRWVDALVVVDCDDNNRTVHPRDADGDGYSTCDRTPDCDDSDARIAPYADEVCNGLDDNCNGAVDEHATDTDGDGLFDCDDTCPDTVPVAPTLRVSFLALVTDSARPSGGSRLTPEEMPVVFVNGVDLGRLGTSNRGNWPLFPAYINESGSPYVQDFELPSGLWQPFGVNTVTLTQLPGRPIPSAEQKVTMIRSIRVELVYDDGVPSRNAAHTLLSYDSSYECGRPSWFFGTAQNRACPAELERALSPFEPGMDFDGDGVWNDCDPYEVDAARSPLLPEQCDNGIDDDADGQVDADDEDCCHGTDTAQREHDCMDGVDDDCDGLTDLDDEDCVGATCGLAEPVLTVTAGAARDPRSGTLSVCRGSSSCDGAPTGWLDVVIDDPNDAGWQATLCAPQAVSVALDSSCADATCPSITDGCATFAGRGTTHTRVGLGGSDDACELDWTLEVNR